jgi:hypothetical protein
MAEKIRSWKDCLDARKVESYVNHQGCTVVSGHGDHRKIFYKGQEMTFYTKHDISTGVAHAIFKWLVSAGLVEVAGLFTWIFLANIAAG